MKPFILVTTEVSDDGKAMLNQKYSEAVLDAGAMAIIMPYIKDDSAIDKYVEMADGFLFTGGVDVYPKWYGEEKLATCGDIQPLRDEIEFKLWERAYKTGKPILTICRGTQVANIALGGTLYQDIPTECPSDICHRQESGTLTYSHSVNVIEGTPLYDISGCERIPANSFHHQALKELGRGLAVMATADDGIIEALYSTEHPYLRLYQWHPERLYHMDERMQTVFREFVEKAKEK